MPVVPPGDAILELMQNATTRIVIVAPYIKSAIIRRLLGALPDTVSDCVCITRWLPEDIASGVCDLEIFDDVTRLHGGRLLVHPHLHAKYYSNSQNTLVGSVNLTSRGLGWHTPSNVEFLVALPAESPGLIAWETALLDSAVQVTEQLCEQINMQAEQLKQTQQVRHPPEVEDETAEEEAALWVPQCPVPDRLWEVYRGRGTDTMVTSAFKAAQDDLKALSPPQGLTEDLFTKYVSGILRQMPLLSEIDKLSSTGLTDTRAQKFLSNHLNVHTWETNEYDRIWHVIKLWILYFFQESYRLETGQDILVKGKEVSRR